MNGASSARPESLAPVGSRLSSGARPGSQPLYWSDPYDIHEGAALSGMGGIEGSGVRPPATLAILIDTDSGMLVNTSGS